MDILHQRGPARNWPTTPGPQPCNQIGTLYDSLRRIHAPRRRRPDEAPATLADVRRLRARVQTLERLVGAC